MRLNIAYATTHGWNIGDDFIRIGCERLLETIFPNHNHIIYDKSPYVRDIKGLVYEKCNNEFHGNSLQVLKHSKLKIDLMVVAGTPENSSDRMLKFFEVNQKTPVIALAVGEPLNKPKTKFIQYFKRCGILTVRSKGILGKYVEVFGDNIHYLPCTSLFWTDKMKQVDEVRKVALGWKCKERTGLTYNSIPQKYYDKMISLYERLVSENKFIEFFIVCHHVDELKDAMEHFPNLDIRYHYDEHKYADIYWDADFVITPKVHGCGCCASMGIGGAFLPTDFRSDTVDGFLSTISWDKDEICGAMMKGNEISEKLKTHKEESFSKYVELLEKWKKKIDFN